MAPIKTLMILPEGAEEMEAVITADVLRRAGIEVIIAGLDGSGPVKCSRDVVLMPDVSLEEAVKSRGPFDAVILPGGLGGTERLKASDAVKNVLKNQENDGKLVAAICAAPLALKAHGIGQGKKVTNYPALEDQMAGDGYTYLQDRVVEDGKLITSRGPGTAFEFALALVKHLKSKEASDELIGPLLLKL
ncbi:unnamed protein product [Cyprideis torosa]|nr:unnamed protein product [Cyprideis torosa]CAG0881142.1 unnamed protein product [Cyprideis torosa]